VLLLLLRLKRLRSDEDLPAGTTQQTMSEITHDTQALIYPLKYVRKVYVYMRRHSRGPTVEGGTLAWLSLGGARLGRALDRVDEVLAVLDINIDMDGVNDLHIHSDLLDLLTRAAAPTEKAAQR
jgi:hypothetical protein